jgi:hypothetical protein
MSIFKHARNKNEIKLNNQERRIKKSKLYGKYNRDIIKANRQYAEPSATGQKKQTKKNQSSNAAWSLIY